MSVTEDTETIRTLFHQQHGFVTSKIMFTACELGVFDVLWESGEPLSSATIAERLGISPTGAERLLETCVSLKLLRMERKDGEGFYGNTKLANLLLAKQSPKSQHRFLKLQSEVNYHYLKYLTDIVREGKVLSKKTPGILSNNFFETAYSSEEEVQRFSDAMDDAWRLFGKEVMSAFDLSCFPLICDLGGLYENANIASLYLAKSSPKSQYHYTKVLSELAYPSFRFYSDAVREGKKQLQSIYGQSANNSYEALSRSQTQLAANAMDDIWRLYGQEVLSAFDLSHFSTIYDLGGGSGALSKQLISLYPNATVTVLDRPQVVETAKEHLGSSEECRITFQGGDLFTDPIPEADLYILARVLFNWDDEKCLLLLRKLHKACKPGGGVLIIEPILDEDRNGPPETHIYSAPLILYFDGKGKTFSEYNTLLSAAGFTEMQRKKGNFFDVIWGRK